MELHYSRPDPAGSERARMAKAIRDLATEVARLRPSAATLTNQEEVDHDAPFPANFTKGLLHTRDGVLDRAEDYRQFVEAINSPDRTLFENRVRSADDAGVVFACRPSDTDKQPLEWRGWESPRAGHVYELQGADAGSVGMAPAPRIGSSELAAEMAEVYALAILRDVPFTEIAKGGNVKLCSSHETGEKSVRTADTLVKYLNEMPFYNGTNIRSSTPGNTDDSGLNRFERNRRFARTQSIGGALTPALAFRGSTPGALVGPYISQFLLIGADSLAGDGDGVSNWPRLNAAFDLEDGLIPYGSLIIDQRTITHKSCLDYMTDWCSWLDVQNGANLRGLDQFEPDRRFITTPRDLATYVHYDALYEAYLNAGLVMLGLGIPRSKGFPEVSPSGRRDAFATFGGPHILSLVTEVATRCLKAVRRQKFNYHRRARPEAIGGRLVTAALDGAAKPEDKKLGRAHDAFQRTLDELPADLLKAVKEHNDAQKAVADHRSFTCCAPGEKDVDGKVCSCEFPCGVNESAFDAVNYLLPMAFPEGSPMHASYGAGHATVAGGCVTMLKAFFDMFEDGDSFVERQLFDRDGNAISFVPKADGSALEAAPGTTEALTVQGELDKLAANISIGRNMAGVHYYSDYYDSLRMGERIAVSILLEQAPTYVEEMSVSFTSFDGDFITLSGEGESCPNISIIDRDGSPVSPSEWWLRHVPGEALIEDF